MNLIKRLPMLVVIAAAAWVLWAVLPATISGFNCTRKGLTFDPAGQLGGTVKC